MSIPIIAPQKKQKNKQQIKNKQNKKQKTNENNTASKIHPTILEENATCQGSARIKITL